MAAAPVSLCKVKETNMLDCAYCGRDIDQSELSFTNKFVMGEIDEKTGEPEDLSFLHTYATCECGYSNSFELTHEEANA